MIYEISLLAASISIFINYIIGKPGSEFSPYEIFSGYTVWLSRHRLITVGLYESYWFQCVESCKRAKTKHELVTIKNDMRRVYYNAAEPFFTWERAFGMCVICTGFWVSLITGLCFTRNFVDLLQIVVFSHLGIRILTKFL
jgi:hypothetical protein